MKPTYSVVTCFINYKGKILLLQRAKKDTQYGLWGIPGGKLEEHEDPETGLAREIKEELNLDIEKNNFKFLLKTQMKNSCDGSYFLYLYYLNLTELPHLSLNETEHLAYTWVVLENFKNQPLLFCQGIAFDKVKNKLKTIIFNEEMAIC